MSKRTKKDIKTADELVSAGGSPTLPSDSMSPGTTNAGVAKKRTTKKTAKTAVLEPGQVNQDDPELEELLLQVDTMLTEMTQSKWLSSDWPTLEIDMGNNRKK